MKRLYFFSLIMVLFTSIVFAQNCSSCPIQKNDNPEGLDDSDLFKKNERVVFLNGEFLYWTASLSNNEYAFQYDRAISDSNVYNGLGKYIFSKYSFDPGFRFALGYFNAPKTYQVIGQFTWIRIYNENSIERTQPYDQPLCATFPQEDLGMDQLTQAKSKIRLNHELGDILASRGWYPNLHLRLHMFGGITGGRLQQVWNVYYTDILSQIEKIENRWKFTGIGLRLGVDVDWFWTTHFYLTGKVSFAPLIGRYNYLGKILVQPNNLQKAYFNYDQYRGAYNVQAYFGPSYQRAYCKYRYEIFLGYELNGWFNVNEKIINISAYGDDYLKSEVYPFINNGLFLLHGLTTRITVDF